MGHQLKTRVDGPINFQTIPDHMKIYQGKVNKVIQTSVGLLVTNLKLGCSRKTYEDGEKYGHIALLGQGSLGSLDLQFSLTLMENFKWVTREDLTQIQWQQLSMKLPPTHISLDTMEGKYRLSYYEQMARWEHSGTIDTKIAEIIKERGTQTVKMEQPRGLQTRPEGGKPGQGGGDQLNNEVRQGDNNKPIHNNEIQSIDMKAASAPQYQTMKPTTTRTEEELDFKTRTELDFQTKTKEELDVRNRTGLDFQTGAEEELTYIKEKPI